MTTEVANKLKSYYSLCRYQSTVLTSNDLTAQDRLVTAVRRDYPSFDCWHHPGVDNAPPLNCYVTDFCKRAFLPTRQGLLIIDPEQWLYQDSYPWSFANRGTFWSRLSGHYGGAPVIVFAKDVIATTQWLESYFKPHRFSDCETRLWVSKYQGD